MSLSETHEAEPFEFELDEKSLVGSMYMARVADEIRRVAAIEKAARKITQQQIADKVGTSRAVINREMSGLENLTARRQAEILWALGWEPYFEARKIPPEQNYFISPKPQALPEEPAPAKKYQPLTKLGSTIALEMVTG